LSGEETKLIVAVVEMDVERMGEWGWGWGVVVAALVVVVGKEGGGGRRPWGR
jgi:hypothetical protein